MKNILVLMHDDAGQEARFQAALDVTRAVNGHLRCLDVTMLPVIAADYSGPEGVTILVPDQARHEMRQAFRARLAREDVPWEWWAAAGELAGCLANAAGLADLIVVNRRLDALPYPDMQQVAGDVLLRARKPILAMPPDGKGFDVTGPVLVAWNGSPRAMAALTAAVPLLAFSRDVAIVQFDDGTAEAPAEEAAAYLSRHGIHAEIRRISPKVGPARALVEEASNGAFAYAVMGGYGRARLAEAFLGGVTDTMLRESPVPLFLAH